MIRLRSGVCSTTIEKRYGGIIGMERVRFITHKNKNILFIDLSNCNKEHTLETIEKSKDIIKTQPEHSLLALTDITNENMYTPELFQTMEEFVKHNKPYIQASAIIAPGDLLQMYVQTLAYATDRKFSVFDDAEKAKDWLTQE